MQEARNEIKYKEGKEVKIDDPDFDQKLHYNKKTMQYKRNRYRSLVNFCSFDSN